MLITTRPMEQQNTYCASCGARYESDGSSPTIVEVRESPISLERKFSELAKSIFGWRLRKNRLAQGVLVFDRRGVFGCRTALIVRNPVARRMPFPDHEWHDLDIAVRDPFSFRGCLSLASQYQAVTGKRAVVIKEF